MCVLCLLCIRHESRDSSVPYVNNKTQYAEGVNDLLGNFFVFDQSSPLRLKLKADQSYQELLGLFYAVLLSFLK